MYMPLRYSGVFIYVIRRGVVAVVSPHVSLPNVPRRRCHELGVC